MIHVKQIKEMVHQGQDHQAMEAVDNLLSLGPHNLEALKIKADLYEQAGQFEEEADTWNKVLEIDQEDYDAMSYVYRRQLEERENYHFTDSLKNGGKRFSAYPKGLISGSIFLMFGITLFLVLARLSTVYVILQGPIFATACIVICLFGPIFYFIWHLLFSLSYLEVDSAGILVATRIKKRQYSWEQIDELALFKFQSPDLSRSLHLKLTSKDVKQPGFHLNLDTHEATIKARIYLIREIKKYSSIQYEPEIIRKSQLKKSPLQF